MKYVLLTRDRPLETRISETASRTIGLPGVDGALIGSERLPRLLTPSALLTRVFIRKFFTFFNYCPRDPDAIRAGSSNSSNHDSIKRMPHARVLNDMRFSSLSVATMVHATWSIYQWSGPPPAPG